MDAGTTKISIVIVDDHPLFRQGLRQVIVADPRFELVGETDDGRAAVAMIQRLAPDLAVLDINLPGLSGLDVASALRDAHCRTQLAVLTMLKDEPAFNRAMNIGILGYILKENAVSEIVNCLISAASGMPYVSPSLSTFLLRRRDKAQALASHVPTLDDLTVAERRILKRIADKKSSKEIAAELGVSPRTVDSHRANICTKLELRGNNSLLQFAIEHRDTLAGLR
jgi:two-component system, NarL family, response regulator DegU